MGREAGAMGRGRDQLAHGGNSEATSRSTNIACQGVLCRSKLALAERRCCGILIRAKTTSTTEENSQANCFRPNMCISALSFHAHFSGSPSRIKKIRLGLFQMTTINPKSPNTTPFAWSEP